jgi:hypothetical protein
MMRTATTAMRAPTTFAEAKSVSDSVNGRDRLRRCKPWWRDFATTPRKAASTCSTICSSAMTTPRARRRLRRQPGVRLPASTVKYTPHDVGVRTTQACIRDVCNPAAAGADPSPAAHPFSCNDGNGPPGSVQRWSVSRSGLHPHPILWRSIRSGPRFHAEQVALCKRRGRPPARAWGVYDSDDPTGYCSAACALDNSNSAGSCGGFSVAVVSSSRSVLLSASRLFRRSIPLPARGVSIGGS